MHPTTLLATTLALLHPALAALDQACYTKCMADMEANWTGAGPKQKQKDPATAEPPRARWRSACSKQCEVATPPASRPPSPKGGAVKAKKDLAAALWARELIDAELSEILARNLESGELIYERDGEEEFGYEF